MASSPLHMIEGSETCPCGSGQLYRDCCLRTSVRYFRDASGRAVSFSLDCTPSSSPESSDTVVPGDGDETCDHDCEHCDRHHAEALLVVTRKDGVSVHVDYERFSVLDMKQTLIHIAIAQACLIRALSSPLCRDSAAEGAEDLPILVVLEGEGGEFSYGAPHDYSSLSEHSITSSIASLEKLRTEFILWLYHIGLVHGSASVLGYESAVDDDE